MSSQSKHSRDDQRSHTSPQLTVWTLKRHVGEMQQYLDVNLLVTYLLSEGMLTQNEECTVTNPLLPIGDRVRSLVTFVSRKGPQGPKTFLECVRRSSIDYGHGGHVYIHSVLSTDTTGNQMGIYRIACTQRKILPLDIIAWLMSRLLSRG